ncbi:MAG TPA: ankyrin repeat domain-containing protein [Planctomycetota bacterium]|nr:ankyrin repeat domain-containing protein [Planctomycetota bacterium]
MNSDSPRPPFIRTLEEARRYPDSFFYLDCENEIVVTSPVKLVHCEEKALQQMSDDLGLYGPLTDATNCVFFESPPNVNRWSKEQLSGAIWVAPEYETVLGPAIRLLLSGGADDIYNERFDPTAIFFGSGEDRVGITPMYRAARWGDIDLLVRMFRLSSNVNARNLDGNTPLHGAAESGKVEVIARLLEAGADVNARNVDGKTPLHLALMPFWVTDPARTDSVELLVRNGADVNARAADDRTPLRLAQRWPNNSGLRQMLVDRGATLDGMPGGTQ